MFHLEKWLKLEMSIIRRYCRSIIQKLDIINFRADFEKAAQTISVLSQINIQY